MCKCINIYNADCDTNCPLVLAVGCPRTSWNMVELVRLVLSQQCSAVFLIGILNKEWTWWWHLASVLLIN